MSGAYYNEFDPKAAAWLRELIKRGHIADGIVDERDLWDISPADLRGFSQVHLCAGIGVWSYALRSAGWPDDRPVWTASFPCQPFSAAGKGKGFADERHLWPAGHFLIEECRPPVVFGEQVASKDGLDWLDLVQADLEGSGYACGAVDLCAAGLGAPHIRQRLYWTAERLANPDGRNPSAERQQRGGEQRQQPENGGTVERVAYATDQRHEWSGAARGRGLGLADDSAARGRWGVRGGDTSAIRPGPTNGLWRDADWLFCRDGKWRPVEPGTFPLVAGVAKGVGRGGDSGAPVDPQRSAEGRAMRLRGYGNAIVAAAAQAFIEAYIGDTPNGQ